MTTEAERTAATDVSKLPRMSETPAPPPPTTEEIAPRGGRNGEARRGPSRVGIVIVLIVSIVLAGITSSWARNSSGRAARRAS